MAGSNNTTITHRHPPEVRPDRASRKVLVAAFPAPAAVELPPYGVAVGRGWLTDAGIPDDEVSRQQVVFVRQGEQVLVQDAGSRNGTWVDGVPLARDARRKIHDGALIRFGRTLFVYRGHMHGDLTPSEPLDGRMVGPYGLRGIAQALDDIRTTRPGCVLLEGPTGSGKELVANCVAAALGRDHRLTRLNVAAIPDSMFEGHLFGHTRNAFTGASAASPGVLRAADGGAVFLDEIGSLPLALQAKLLRFLDTHEVQTVGASRPEKVDVAVIAANNTPLQDLVSEDLFRPDLAYRLARRRITLPSLSDRIEDILPIAHALLARRGMRFSADAIDVEAVEYMLRFDWPGNVRQLDAVVDDIRKRCPDGALPLWAVREVLGPLAQGEVTRQQAEAALEMFDGNQSKAARHLGITRGKLRRLLGLA